MSKNHSYFGGNLVVPHSENTHDPHLCSLCSFCSFLWSLSKWITGQWWLDALVFLTKRSIFQIADAIKFWAGDTSQDTFAKIGFSANAFCVFQFNRPTKKFLNAREEQNACMSWTVWRDEFWFQVLAFSFYFKPLVILLVSCVLSETDHWCSLVLNLAWSFLFLAYCSKLVPALNQYSTLGNQL